MLLVALIASAGLALRVLVLRSRLGDLNADEAYAGLQSLGVVRDGRFPVVIDGNVYSAALESYLFGPILHFAGGNIATLKLLFVGMWAVAAVTVAVAARQLAGRTAGLVAGTLVWLAPGALLVVSTRAYMCYALGLAVVGATVAATAHVADRPAAHWRSSAIAGFLAGLGFYIHPMFVTVLGPVIAVAAVRHYRDVRQWWLPAVAGAVLANGPFLAWNALNGWPSLGHQVYPPGTYRGRLEGFVVGLLPRGFGLRDLTGDWVFGKPLGLVVYAALVAAAVAGCVTLLRGSTRPSRFIVPVTLAASLPLMALLPHLVYVDDGRYTILPFPFAVIAAAAGLARLTRSWEPPRVVATIGAVAVVWVSLSVLPFLGREHAFTTASPNTWQDRVIARLDEAGIDRLAGGYWLVLPVEYRSDRTIRTAVEGFPHVIRFPRSQHLVEQASPDRVAFVFGARDEQASLLFLPLDRYRREDLGSVILYLPPAAKA